MYYNFKTQQSDNRLPITDEIAKEYIWQDDNAQAIYDLYRELGNSILETLVKVLEAQLKEIGKQS